MTRSPFRPWLFLRGWTQKSPSGTVAVDLKLKSLLEKYRMAKVRLLTVALGWLLMMSLLVFTVPPALAETILEEPPAPTSILSADLNATDIPSEKVDQFVSAYLQVVELIDERSEELQRAETEAESLRLQQTIQIAAFQLIEEAGLSRQDYWQLLGLANTDPEFRDRVLAQMEERDR